MKARFVCVLITLVCRAQILSAELELNRNDKFEFLVHTCPNGDRSTPLLIQRWNMEMDKIPNATEKILDLLERFRSQGASGEQTFRILTALWRRQNLQPGQLERLAREIRLMDTPRERPNHQDQNYIVGVLNVLRDYPTDEHESLGLKFLQAHDSVSLAAYNLLADIGGVRSFHALEHYLAEFRRANEGYVNWSILHLEERMAFMSRRLVNEGKLPPSAIRSPVTVEEAGRPIRLERSNTPNQAVAPGTGALPESSGLIAWVVILMCFAALGLLWIFLRQLTRKKKAA
ncbi:MAG TPA: hypothetical protein DIT64_07570 [Verrucomicrobiales bacterium]|nr:hypothetical protein [Verrucomicrobiales bacterium]